MLKEYRIDQEKDRPAIAYLCDTETYWHLVEFFNVPKEETEGGWQPFEPDQDEQAFWIWYSLVIGGGGGIISPCRDMTWGRVYVMSDVELDFDTHESKRYFKKSGYWVDRHQVWYATGFYRQEWLPWSEKKSYDFETGRRSRRRSLSPKVVAQQIMKDIVKELPQGNN